VIEMARKKEAVEDDESMEEVIEVPKKKKDYTRMSAEECAAHKATKR